MPLHFKDVELEELARLLASERRTTITSAMKYAVRLALGATPASVSDDVATAVDRILAVVRPIKQRMMDEAARRSADALFISPVETNSAGASAT